MLALPGLTDLRDGTETAIGRFFVSSVLRLIFLAAVFRMYYREL